MGDGGFVCAGLFQLSHCAAWPPLCCAPLKPTLAHASVLHGMHTLHNQCVMYVTICVCLCVPISLPQAFYNGFLPNFARLGSWNVAMFLMLEQVRTKAGGQQRGGACRCRGMEGGCGELSHSDNPLCLGMLRTASKQRPVADVPGLLLLTAEVTVMRCCFSAHACVILQMKVVLAPKS